MTILRTGSSRQYSENWAKAFGERKSKTTTTKKTSAKKRGARAKASKK